MLLNNLKIYPDNYNRKVMTERQVILSNLEALVGADLNKAFKAVRADKVRNIIVHFQVLWLMKELSPMMYPFIKLTLNQFALLLCNVMNKKEILLAIKIP